jgi:hypothetical protein
MKKMKKEFLVELVVFDAVSILIIIFVIHRINKIN